MTTDLEMNRSDYLIAALVCAFIFSLLLFLSGGRLDFLPDGANAMHVAQNFLDGEGLVEKRASPSAAQQNASPDVTKPPLFPFLIAAITSLGLDPITAGSVLTMLSFSMAAGIIYLTARLAVSRLASVAILLLFCIHVAGLTWVSKIHEQWLFVSFSFASLFLLAILRRKSLAPEYPLWFALGVLSAVSLLASYQGFPLVVMVVAVVLADSIRNPIRWRRAGMFGVGLFVTGIVPFLRFVYQYSQGIKPGFIGSADVTLMRVAADFVHILQLDFLGRLVVWVGDGSLGDIAVMALAFVLLGVFLWRSNRREAISVLNLYIFFFVVFLILKAGFSGFPRLEPRFVLPIMGPLIVVFAVSLLRSAESMDKRIRWFGTLASLGTLLVFVNGQVLRFDSISKHWEADRLRGYCPSPETMKWVTDNIPAGSVVISPQCGYQMFAEANEYFWLRIPPADEYSTSPKYLERWSKNDLVRVSRITKAQWVVILLGNEGDPLADNPGYGSFVTGLINGDEQDGGLRKVASFSDGWVYKID